MKVEELNFMGENPGAVKYGNFINYYSFHSANERIQHLDPLMFPPACKEVFCLDVGCNTDIDPNLIKRAEEINDEPTICYNTVNIMDQTDCKKVKDYLNLHGKNMFDITFCFSVTMWIHLNNGDDGLHNFLQKLKSLSKIIIIEPQHWSCYRNAQRRMKKSGGTFPLYESLKIRSNVDNVIDEILIGKTHKNVYESPSSNWKRKIKCYHLAKN